MRGRGWLVASGVLAVVATGVWLWFHRRGPGGATNENGVVPTPVVRELDSDTVGAGITSIGSRLWWVEFVVTSRLGGEVVYVEIAQDRNDSQTMAVINGTAVVDNNVTGATRAGIRRWRREGSGDTIVVATPQCEPLVVSVREVERVGDAAEARWEVVVDYNRVVPPVLGVGEMQGGATASAGRYSLLDSVIQFEFDDDSVMGERVGTVQRLSRVLSERRELTVWVEGHTDSIGDTVYNRTLGMRRAEAVSRVLLQEGIDSSRVVLSSAGESQSRGSNLRRDRRAELFVGPCPDGNRPESRSGTGGAAIG